MASQLEMLKEKLPKLEAEFGPGNPYVQGLKAQIAKLEKPRAENPMEFYSAGMRGAPARSSAAEPPETEQDGQRAQELRIAKLYRNNPKARDDALAKIRAAGKS